MYRKLSWQVIFAYLSRTVRAKISRKMLEKKEKMHE